jgi:hypothetical protein
VGGQQADAAEQTARCAVMLNGDILVPDSRTLLNALKRHDLSTNIG